MNSAWRNWSAGDRAGARAEQAAAIAAAIAGREGAFGEAVLIEALRQDRDLIGGIAAYRRHPWRRTLTDPPEIWREGNSRILDYSGTANRAAQGAPANDRVQVSRVGSPRGRRRGGARTALFVPSLVNRSYVLDLAPGQSMLRAMSGEGIRPLLLDWGWPGAAERRFTLTDYVAGRLERALVAAAQDGPVVLAGYCMGGLLALAAAQRRPELVSGLALLATPWDFHGRGPEQAEHMARLLPLLEPAMALGHALPVDALQMLFALLDPYAIAAKYRTFARMDPAGERARMFVAMEDWLNDGIPLAAPVAREALSGWYGANTTARGQWTIAGLPVEPSLIDRPAFVAVPARDNIVPPESARPLAGLLPRAVLCEPPAGHVGMVAGANAATALWQPLGAWIRRV